MYVDFSFSVLVGFGDHFYVDSSATHDRDDADEPDKPLVGATTCSVHLWADSAALAATTRSTGGAHCDC
jgi:hypothetical protein